MYDSSLLKLQSDIQGDWNKNFIVGHIGRHSDFYRIENQKILDDLFNTAQRESLTREEVFIKLKNVASDLRDAVKGDPTSLYQNPNKPVIVLE